MSSLNDTPLPADLRFQDVPLEDLDVAIFVVDFQPIEELMKVLRAKQSETEIIEAIETTDLIYEFTKRLRFLGVNQVAVDLLGARDVNHLVNHFAETSIDASLDGYRSYFAQLASGAKVIEQDTERRKFSGEKLHVRIRSRLVESDNHPKIVSSVVDISDHVTLQERLRRTESKQRLAIEASDMTIWDMSFSNSEILFDSHYRDFFGNSDRGLSGPLENFTSLIHGDDRDHAIQMIKQLRLGDSKTIEATFRILCANGAYRWFLCRGEVVEWLKSKMPCLAIGTLRDVHVEVTGQQLLKLDREVLSFLAADRSLQESLEHFARGIESIWKHVRCAINLVDPVTETFQKGAAPSLGQAYRDVVDGFPICGPTTVCGKSVVERKFVYYSDLREAIELAEILPFYESLGARGCWSFPVLLGDQILATCCMFTQAPLTPTESEIVQLERLAQTVGLLLEAERQSREKEAFEAAVRTRDRLEGLGKLAGGIAHDFNNLLTVVMTNAELIQQLSGGTSKECANQIENAARLAGDLCKKMLTYAGSVPFQQKSIDLSEAVLEIVRMIESGSPVGVTFVVDSQSGISRTLADPGMISQIVMNLVTNAVDSVSGSGLVSIFTGEANLQEDDFKQMFLNDGLTPGDYVFVRVDDNGDGIEPDAIARIFDPFFSTKPEGRGLGLATVFGAVNRHRGGFSVASTVGKGSSFTVFLPATDAADEGHQSVSEQSSFGTTQRHVAVAVVDDEEMVRNAIESLLSMRGFSVRSFSSGDEVLENIEELLECDVVLLDQQMPGRDGLATYREIRQKLKRIPVCFISGYGASTDVSKVVREDDRCTSIEKPFSSDGLFDLIWDLVKDQTARNQATSIQ